MKGLITIVALLFVAAIVWMAYTHGRLSGWNTALWLMTGNSRSNTAGNAQAAGQSQTTVEPGSADSNSIAGQLFGTDFVTYLQTH